MLAASCVPMPPTPPRAPCLEPLDHAEGSGASGASRWACAVSVGAQAQFRPVRSCRCLDYLDCFYPGDRGAPEAPGRKIRARPRRRRRGMAGNSAGRFGWPITIAEGSHHSGMNGSGKKITLSITSVGCSHSGWNPHRSILRSNRGPINELIELWAIPDSCPSNLCTSPYKLGADSSRILSSIGSSNRPDHS